MTKQDTTMRLGRLFRRVLAVSCAVFMSMPMVSNAIILRLDGLEEQCFHEYVRTKRTAFIRIGVLESFGTYSVRLKAFGPFPSYPVEVEVNQNFFDRLVTTVQDEKNQNIERSGFNFNSEHRGGWYRFCLDNSHDSNQKTVEWYTSYDLSNKEELGEEDELENQIRKEHLTGVKTSLDRLETLLKLIRNEQDYYRARVHRHVQTLYSSESRIMYYTVFELVVLGVMYGVQSFLLHKWFSDRDSLSKHRWV
ncbi:unnamed protein product [Peronospora belbahrii]|uniref:GOLD domain-containing protein n=1 Tax=Peronospora belbahrii TaxID=622444 RepID=A0AAU9KSP6_9STRA|nr:unnamed protein product [Peronospora belbahrii]CAH0517051.1 unnamed protein product [Peronospora belbahrii]